MGGLRLGANFRRRRVSVLSGGHNGAHGQLTKRRLGGGGLRPQPVPECQRRAVFIRQRNVLFHSLFRAHQSSLKFLGRHCGIGDNKLGWLSVRRDRFTNGFH